MFKFSKRYMISNNILKVTNNKVSIKELKKIIDLYTDKNVDLYNEKNADFLRKSFLEKLDKIFIPIKKDIVYTQYGVDGNIKHNGFIIKDLIKNSENLFCPVIGFTSKPTLKILKTHQNENNSEIMKNIRLSPIKTSPIFDENKLKDQFLTVSFINKEIIRIIDEDNIPDKKLMNTNAFCANDLDVVYNKSLIQHVIETCEKLVVEKKISILIQYSDGIMRSISKPLNEDSIIMLKEIVGSEIFDELFKDSLDMQYLLEKCGLDIDNSLQVLKSLKEVVLESEIFGYGFNG